MGRKTWESCPTPSAPARPGEHRGEPQRRPVRPIRHRGGQPARGRHGRRRRADIVFVIGGAELYRQALPIADRPAAHRDRPDFAGDAFFPAFDRTTGTKFQRDPHIAESGLRLRSSPTNGARKTGVQKNAANRGVFTRVFHCEA